MEKHAKKTLEPFVVLPDFTGAVFADRKEDRTRLGHSQVADFPFVDPFVEKRLEGDLIRVHYRFDDVHVKDEHLDLAVLELLILLHFDCLLVLSGALDLVRLVFIRGEEHGHRYLDVIRRGVQQTDTNDVV